MAPRRPSTANDADLTRMSFTSAEALLWGPELKKQHAYLLTEMRTLKKQHEEYDTRIRSAEAVAEAAEATAARIRRLEQHLAAVEAEDDDKAFEKWASGEITRLKTFIDTNKNVRQKQIELEAKVSRLSETNKFSRDPIDLGSVLQRLDLLEHGRKEDAHRIQSLERELSRLQSIQKSDTSSNGNPKAGSKTKNDFGGGLTPSQLLDTEISNVTTDVDDEEMLLSWIPQREEAQVRQSLTTQQTSPDATIVTSSTRNHHVPSARRRLLQRSSIHNSKVRRPMEEGSVEEAPALAKSPDANLRRISPPPTQLVSRKKPRKEPATAPAPQNKVTAHPRREAPANLKAPITSNAPANVAPPTQLVDKRPPRKRKQPHPEPQPQRLTRSSAKRMEVNEAETQKSGGSNSVPEAQPAHRVEPIPLPRKKPRVTGSPKKKSAPAPPPVTINPKIKKQLIVKLPSPRKPICIDTGVIDGTQSIADRVRRSPRKARAGLGSPFKAPGNFVISRNKQPQTGPGIGSSMHMRQNCTSSDDSHLSCGTASPERHQLFAKAQSPPITAAFAASRS